MDKIGGWKFLWMKFHWSTPELRVKRLGVPRRIETMKTWGNGITQQLRFGLTCVSPVPRSARPGGDWGAIRQNSRLHRPPCRNTPTPAAGRAPRREFAGAGRNQEHGPGSFSPSAAPNRATIGPRCARFEDMSPDPRDSEAHTSSQKAEDMAENQSEPKELTAAEQMALYEKELKENDWGHQPC
jgi:hypothetical protein